MSSEIKQTRTKITNSLSFKLIVLFILILLLLIPVSWVKSLIRERQFRRDEAISEISSKWGKEQTVTGPVLTLPYDVHYEVYNKDKESYETKTKIRYLNLLPETLGYSGKIEPEERYRGIFKVIVYQANLKTNVSFKKPDFEKLEISTDDIHWDKAIISLKLSDFRSLQDEIYIENNKKKYSFFSGSNEKTGIINGVNTVLSINPDVEEWNFNYPLNFNGSSGLLFSPLGKTTTVSIESTWPDPSFIGGFLPDKRNVTETGFDATWKVLHLNRPLPQIYKDGELKNVLTNISSSYNSKDYNGYDFGVKLFVPVDHYKKSERTAKYAILFISLTFISFFSIASINKINIHFVQYILIGLALCIFYSLLLSLSEHIGFDLSYWISSLAIIFLLSFYSKAIFKNFKFASTLGIITFVLYGFIFTIIQMQDFSLLVGSIGLFVVISILMYISLKLKLN